MNTKLNPFKLIAFSLSVGVLAGAFESFLIIRSNMGLDFFDISLVILTGSGLNCLFCLSFCLLFFRIKRSFGLVAGILFSLILCEVFLWPVQLRLGGGNWVYWLLESGLIVVIASLGAAFDTLFRGKWLIVGWFTAFPLVWSTVSRGVESIEGKETDRQNLILITVDGIEPAGFASGEDLKALPTLSSLADESAFFERAYTPTPHEQAAIYALHTGEHPIVSGVDETGQGFEMPASSFSLKLRKRGYETAAFVGSNRVSAEMGLDIGFDLYDDSDPYRSFALMALIDRFRLSGASNRLRPAPVVMENSIKWLKSRSYGPFFLWVHLSDLNGPFDIGDSDLSDTPILGLPLDWPEEIQHVSDKEAISMAYRQSFLAIDTQISRLFEALRERQFDDKTIVVFAGSSGGYGLNSETPFGSPRELSESTLHVPLMVRSERLVQKSRISCLISTETMLSPLLSLLSPSTEPELRLEGVLRGGDCRNEPLLSSGKFISKEGERISQQRLRIPTMVMLRNEKAVECLLKEDSGGFKAQTTCDSRLSLIWKLASAKLKGDSLPRITPEQTRELAELGIE